MKVISLNSKLVAAIALCLWVAGAGLATAQTPRDSLETLRADLKGDRNALIAQGMNLTPEESEAFWPIYRSYRAEVEKVTDVIVELVLEYSDAYPNVPEEKAGDMLKRYNKAEASLLNIKTKYLKKFGKVLPASKVFRFAQLDNRFELGVRVGLATATPLMPAGAAQPAAEKH